jgi:hypothetical protein
MKKVIYRISFAKKEKQNTPLTHIEAIIDIKYVLAAESFYNHDLRA